MIHAPWPLHRSPSRAHTMLDYIKKHFMQLVVGALVGWALILGFALERTMTALALNMSYSLVIHAELVKTQREIESMRSGVYHDIDPELHADEALPDMEPPVYADL